MHAGALVRAPPVLVYFLPVSEWFKILRSSELGRLFQGVVNVTLIFMSLPLHTARDVSGQT